MADSPEVASRSMCTGYSHTRFQLGARVLGASILLVAAGCLAERFSRLNARRLILVFEGQRDDSGSIHMQEKTKVLLYITPRSSVFVSGLP